MKKAAYAGIANAQLQLGMLYVQGKAIATDDLTAYAWLTIAATTDHPEIQPAQHGCVRCARKTNA